MTPTDELAAALADEGQAVLEKWPIQRNRLRSGYTGSGGAEIIVVERSDESAAWVFEDTVAPTVALSILTRHLEGRLAAWAAHEGNTVMVVYVSDEVYVRIEDTDENEVVQATAPTLLAALLAAAAKVQETDA